VSWEIVYAKQAMKDAKKLAASGLKPKAQELLAVLAHDPFQNPPPFEKLVGDLAGAYSSPHQYSAPHGVRSFCQRENGSCLAYVDAL
jgi:hypothetical protein